jgi:acyl carrier protein
MQQKISAFLQEHMRKRSGAKGFVMPEPGDDLSQSAGFDSLELSILLVAIEKEFSVSFTRQDFTKGKMRSLATITALIEEKCLLKK